MKKICLMFSVAFLLLSSQQAVNAQSKAELGIKGGVSLSNFGGSDVKNLDDKNAGLGFIGGITLDLPVTESVYILTGLEYVMKGAKYESKGNVASASMKFTPTYLQLPIHIGVKLPITEQTKVVLGVGPYVAYGIGGKAKAEGSITSVGGKTSSDFFGDNSLAKRFDLGAGINAGLELGKLSLGVGYDLGFMNILNKDNDIQDQFKDNSPSLRNQSAYLTVGVRF